MAGLRFHSQLTDVLEPCVGFSGQRRGARDQEATGDVVTNSMENMVVA